MVRCPPDEEPRRQVLQVLPDGTSLQVCKMSNVGPALGAGSRVAGAGATIVQSGPEWMQSWWPVSQIQYVLGHPVLYLLPSLYLVSVQCQVSSVKMSNAAFLGPGML